MSYGKSWGSGFDFQDLGEAVGLKGLKPMRHHWESTVGLHGFNEAGKAHGANALGAALIFGGSQAMGAMGGGAAGAGGGAAGGSGGMFSGLFGGGSGAASSGSSGITLGGGVPDFGAEMGSTGGDAGGLLAGFEKYAKPVSQGLGIGQQIGGMNQQQPIQPAQLPQRSGPDLSQFIAAEAQRNQAMEQEKQNRLMQQQMALGGLLGGGYGRSA